MIEGIKQKADKLSKLILMIEILLHFLVLLRVFFQLLLPSRVWQ